MSNGPLTEVRVVELRSGLEDLADVGGAQRLRIYAAIDGRILGFAELLHRGQPVSAARLREELAAALHVRLLPDAAALGDAETWAEALAAFAEHLAPATSDAPSPPARLPSASVVIATLDRPDDLRACLSQLAAQATSAPVEVIVVDNNPASGLTGPVVADFPDVVVVREQRRGLSYARNAGIAVARGDVVVMTDDDVRMPADWLDKLLAPFARPDVGAVTGNVLPLELATRAQRLFEVYGGLGRGFQPREFDAGWLERFRSAAPTWKLGATANAAFRTSVLRDPAVGPLHEALGAGMPAAVGEDTLLFYRVLKAGHTLVYAPEAHVWHRHRRDMAGLRAQLYGYSKGHVAYHLTTLLEDHDLRALHYLLVRLPSVQARRIVQRLRRRAPYPLPLNLLEIAGNLAGPVAFVQSRRRVRENARQHQAQEARCATS